MKILTGRFRGRDIPLVSNPELRPTADKVRKAAFDTLQGYAEGKRVLDLYSGTGAMGLESLSQGASYVRFVEQDREQANRIKELVKRWGFESTTDVDAMDALRAIEGAGFRKDSYELVFMDAPYKLNRGAETLKALADSGIVAKGGFVFLECGKREELPEELLPFKRVRDRRYGMTRVAVYQG